MDTQPICPGCERPLPANAPEGLCPACLIQGVLDSELAGDRAAQSESRQPQEKQFDPPTVHEIARFFPQLDVLEFIGRGGMGAVYKARQKQLDRVVALKILPPGIGADAAFTERFLREGQTMARLSHPGIVTIHDFGQTDGLYYFVMEFVDGVTLRQLLSTSCVSAQEALAIVPQICDALQYAHEQGIVHRDIKPENILLDRQGRVKIADFGLARLVGFGVEPALPGGSSVASLELTGVGQHMGTPQYMAPEQRQRPHEVDHRADIYSLGVVFFQMLTGELPTSQFDRPSRRIPIDVRLDDVVLRALEQDPRRRYQQASLLKTQVEAIATTPPQPHENASSWDHPTQRSDASDGRKHSRKVAILASLVALSALGLAMAVVSSRISSPADPQTRTDTRLSAAAERPSSSTTNNILLNSGMEEGTRALAQWKQGAAIHGVEYLWDRQNGYQSKSSLCLHKTARGYFPIAQWYQIVPREGSLPVLQISAWVKAEQVTKAIVDVIFLTQDGQWISHQWASYIGVQAGQDPPADHDWRQCSGGVDIPAGTKKIQISLQIYGPGKIWFDDVRAAYAQSANRPASGTTAQ